MAREAQTLLGYPIGLACPAHAKTKALVSTICCRQVEAQYIMGPVSRALNPDPLGRLAGYGLAAACTVVEKLHEALENTEALPPERPFCIGVFFRGRFSPREVARATGPPCLASSRVVRRKSVC